MWQPIDQGVDKQYNILKNLALSEKESIVRVTEKLLIPYGWCEDVCAIFMFNPVV